MAFALHPYPPRPSPPRSFPTRPGVTERCYKSGHAALERRQSYLSRIRFQSAPARSRTRVTSMATVELFWCNVNKALDVSRRCCVNLSLRPLRGQFVLPAPSVPEFGEGGRPSAGPLARSSQRMRTCMSRYIMMSFPMHLHFLSCPAH